jgi:hypothetical protein
MISPEIKPVFNLVEPAMQGQLSDDRMVGMVVAVFLRHPAEDLGADHTTVVVTLDIE